MHSSKMSTGILASTWQATERATRLEVGFSHISKSVLQWKVKRDRSDLCNKTDQGKARWGQDGDQDNNADQSDVLERECNDIFLEENSPGLLSASVTRSLGSLQPITDWEADCRMCGDGHGDPLRRAVQEHVPEFASQPVLQVQNHDSLYKLEICQAGAELSALSVQAEIALSASGDR